jgi:hypothetical protein
MSINRFKNLVGDASEFVLEVETRTFEARQAEFQKRYPGKVIILHGTELVGAFDSMDIAIREAIDRFGNAPCLIREVEAPSLSESGLTVRLAIR